MRLAGGIAAVAALAALVVVLLLGGSGPGDLDSDFGSGGKVITDFGTPVRALDLAISSDGGIVAAGASGDAFGPGGRELAIAHYAPDGSLDASFGSGGKLITDVGFEVNAVAIAPDGHVVVAGATEPTNGMSRFALARYRPDGSLDPGFGDGGTTTTDFDLAADARTVVIAPDGGIVAAGLVRGGDGDDSLGDEDFALARYTADGRLDRGFGDGGTVVTRFRGDAIVNDLAVDGDGAIVAAGSAATGVLARYTPDGSLDRSFANRGRLAVDVARLSFVSAVAIDARGGLIAAGRDIVVRYDADGTLDRSFADDGAARSELASGANVVALAADGNVVVVGDAGTQRFALSRYRPDGALDDDLGEVTTELASEARALTVAIAPGGEIVLAGTAGGDFALARYRG